VRDAPDIAIGECGTCFGLWLDNRGCALLLSGELSEAARQTIRLLDARPVPSQETAGGYRETARPSDRAEAPRCPVCAEELSLHVTDEARQGVSVRLDICPAHGTWFDGGEAWTLLQAVELKALALDVELRSDALERSWESRQRAWNGFVASASAGTMRRMT
jgi:Zn-finger nucleic acid-binding protein